MPPAVRIHQPEARQRPLSNPDSCVTGGHEGDRGQDSWTQRGASRLFHRHAEGQTHVLIYVA